MPKYVDFQLYTRYVLCSRVQDLTRFKIIAVYIDRLMIITTLYFE